MDNYQQLCGHTPISIIECMILFSYTDNYGILLADEESRHEPWGSSFWEPGFPVGMSFLQILGIQLKVHSPAQDGVLLSSGSLFCLFSLSVSFLFHLYSCLGYMQKCYSSRTINFLTSCNKIDTLHLLSCVLTLRVCGLSVPGAQMHLVFLQGSVDCYQVTGFFS